MFVIEAVAERYARYRRTEIPTVVSPRDGMVDAIHGLPHYMQVGRSAIDVIASALVAADNPTITTILDLPCGGGRVTRHLQALFPDSTIFVSDIDSDLQAFVTNVLGATAAEPNPDFVHPPARFYDLIFVGSLVTHFDERQFRRAVSWFVGALAPKGLLVLTTHGRRHAFVQDNVRQAIQPELWKPAADAFAASGFGYADYPNMTGYGLSVSYPSWVTRLIEVMPQTRIVSYQEAAWNNHQDAIVVQKRDLFYKPRPAMAD